MTYEHLSAAAKKYGFVANIEVTGDLRDKEKVVQAKTARQFLYDLNSGQVPVKAGLCFMSCSGNLQDAGLQFTIRIPGYPKDLFEDVLDQMDSTVITMGCEKVVIQNMKEYAGREGIPLEALLSKGSQTASQFQAYLMKDWQLELQDWLTLVRGSFLEQTLGLMLRKSIPLSDRCIYIREKFDYKAPNGNSYGRNGHNGHNGHNGNSQNKMTVISDIDVFVAAREELFYKALERMQEDFGIEYCLF